MQKLNSSSLKWLIGLLIGLALLTLAFQTGQSDTGPAHCRPCKPPTPTYTPTLMPPLQTCQVVAVDFDKAEYFIGDPIRITLRVADAEGKPLIGANVDTTVNRQSFTDTIEASAIPTLEDQSGTYDGVYTQTDLPGNYTFKFDVSDFTGPRFLPCSAEGTVRVEPKEPEPLPCQMSVATSGGEQRNDPITLTANVTVDGQLQPDATITTTVHRPDNNTEGPLTFSGNGPYTLTYTKTNIAGDYTFSSLRASDQSGQFLPCTAPDVTVNVPDNPRQCQITKVEFDHEPPQYTVGQTIQLTATLALTNGFTPLVTATINNTDTITLSGSGVTFSGVYTNTNQAQNYNFIVTARDSANNQNQCTAQRTALVGSSSTTPTIIIDLPPQPIDLCRRGPDITGTIAISNVTSLTGAQLEVNYDPSFIQVIDAFRRPRPPVQVKPDPNFDPFLNNVVDVRRGKIFFTASAHSPVTGRGNVIYVDWRLQGRTGVTPITVAAVITDASGTQNVTQSKPLQIIIDSTCIQGTVNLQGQANHSGVLVSTLLNQQTQSYPSGLFAIPSTNQLNFTFPGYLSAQIDLLEGQVANLETITLPAGDANNDQRIDILDLAYLAQHYQSADPVADLNADGIVNILDLALVAGNYQKQGPLTTRQ